MFAKNIQILALDSVYRFVIKVTFKRNVVKVGHFNTADCCMI
jgi:hypothetical protein